MRTAGRAFERLVDHLQERREHGADVFFLQHIQAPDVAERLAERGREIYGRQPEFVSEIGPVIGTHIGPGLLGVAGPAQPTCSAPSDAVRSALEPRRGARGRRAARRRAAVAAASPSVSPRIVAARAC